MSFVIEYDNTIDLIAVNDVDSFKVLHTSKPLNSKNIGCVVYTRNFYYKIGFVIVESGKTVDVKELKLEIFFKPVFFELFNVKPSEYVSFLQSSKVRITDYFGMFINQEKITLFFNFKHSLTELNYLVQFNIQNFGEYIEYNTFKNIDYSTNVIYRTPNVILGHLLTNIYTYTDFVSNKGKETANYDGIVIIERNSIKESLKGKYIRLIDIKNTTDWYVEGKEFPILNLELGKDIRQFRVIGKLPEDKNLEKGESEIKFDFSTGMIIF
jgi:hypothetical protein